MDTTGKSTMEKQLYGVSLFTGAGIGDVGFSASGVEFLATCEVDRSRSALAALNFPGARHFAEDIWHIGDDLVSCVLAELRKRQAELFLVSCTAPCQGMSKNGQGKLLSLIRKGDRPKLDPRNRLILPALNIMKRLHPIWAVFENVVEMRNTIIEDSTGRLRPILGIIEETLAPEYVGKAYSVEFADYGIPQRRQRLITVYTRNEIAKRHFANGIDFIPTRTHSKKPINGLRQWVSVTEALACFPALDSGSREKATSDIPFHRVPVLDSKKYDWISHTPLGASAFDNQCANPACGFRGNVEHGASHDKDGINRAHTTTPLYCVKCGSLLPRPYTEKKDGSLRIMSGYTSAYKRMDPSLPAPALTRNLSYPCSDQKVHPEQNRVLSLAEAMTLQTVSDYPYQWGPIKIPRGNGYRECKVAPDALIRLVIGESVPPRFLHLLGEHTRILSELEKLPSNLSRRRRAEQALLL